MTRSDTQLIQMMRDFVIGLPNELKPAINRLNATYDTMPEHERSVFERQIDDTITHYLTPLVQAWQNYPEHRPAVLRKFEGTVDYCIQALRGYPCHDCGYLNLPTTGPAEYYMVNDDLWAAAEMTPHGGFLCIGCLEERIGRTLTPDDFTDAPINTVPLGLPTERLQRRLGLANGAAA